MHPARSTSVDSGRADVDWGGAAAAAVEVGRFEFENGGRAPMARYGGGGSGHYRYPMAENGHHQQRARDARWTNFCEIWNWAIWIFFSNAGIKCLIYFF